jgi:hypothetical protein
MMSAANPANGVYHHIFGACCSQAKVEHAKSPDNLIRKNLPEYLSHKTDYGILLIIRELTGG